MGLQEERGSDAAELPMRNNSYAVTQDVGLVHVMGGEDDGPT